MDRGVAVGRIEDVPVPCGRFGQERKPEIADAAAALSLLDHGFRPDVIVTDHMMPGMTGLEMARTLRARRDATPILMVTGYAEDLASTAAAQEVELTVLSKPIEPSRLVRSIRDMAAVDG